MGGAGKERARRIEMLLSVPARDASRVRHEFDVACESPGLPERNDEDRASSGRAADIRGAADRLYVLAELVGADAHAFAAFRRVEVEFPGFNGQRIASW